jgi:REP element-mobilizing transposase RayT
MARKPRIEFEGALYHIIARGNQRQDIFRVHEDFVKYHSLLVHYKERYPFILYAYVLIKNHVHLLLETTQTPLSKILQGLQQSYTTYFNRKYGTVGHLFQGRYKAILCDKDEYLLTLIKYIHLNPLRAKVTKTLDGYRWSSHSAYLTSDQRSELLDTDFVLQMFSQKKSSAIKRYIDFMSDGTAVEKEVIYKTVDQRLLGDETFVEMIKGKTSVEIADTGMIRQYSLEKIAGAIESISKVLVSDMRSDSKSRNVTWGRKLFSQIAKNYGYKNLEIANFLKKDQSAVTRYLTHKKSMQDLAHSVIATLQE